MINDIRRKQLIEKCQLVFYGIPVGKNSFSDTPIIGNKTLAQVVVNRVKSITEKPDEFKFMMETITKMVKDTAGKEVHKIKLDKTSKTLVKSGLTDEKGFLIKK